jgi:hypothetical protein
LCFSHLDRFNQNGGIVPSKRLPSALEPRNEWHRPPNANLSLRWHPEPYDNPVTMRRQGVPQGNDRQTACRICPTPVKGQEHAWPTGA